MGYDTADDAAVYELSPDLALIQTVDLFPPAVDDPYEYGLIAAANSLSDLCGFIHPPSRDAGKQSRNRPQKIMAEPN